MLKILTRKSLSSLLIFCLIFQIISMVSPAVNLYAAKEELTLDVTARRDLLSKGYSSYKVVAVENDEIILDYEIKGNEFEIKQPEVVTEIALILDVSTSMANDIGNLQDATKTFVEGLDHRKDVKIALVPFAGFCNPEAYFGKLKNASNKVIGGGGKFINANDPLLLEQASSLKVALKGRNNANGPFDVGSGTNIGDAIRYANNMLVKSENAKTSRKYIILMTDGAATSYTNKDRNNKQNYSKTNEKILLDFMKDDTLINEGNYNEFVVSSVTSGKDQDVINNKAAYYAQNVGDNVDKNNVNTFTVLYRFEGQSSEIPKILPIVSSLLDENEKNKFSGTSEKIKENASNKQKLKDIMNNALLDELGIYFSENNGAQDLSSVFSKVSKEIEKDPKATFDMPIKFSTTLPAGISIKDVLDNLNETSNNFYKDVKNSDIQIKYKRVDSWGIVSETEFKDFPVNITTDSDPLSKGSITIDGEVNEMNLVLQTATNKYRSPDVVIRIKVKLIKPDGDDSPVVLSRIKSTLDYSIPEPTVDDLVKTKKAPVVHANNDVCLALTKPNPIINTNRELVNPKSGKVDLGSTAEIEYKVDGKIGLPVPTFPETIPDLEPEPESDPKEIFFLLDTSMYKSKGAPVVESALNFVLYSMKDLSIEGNSDEIYGRIHTNNLFKSTASKVDVIGGDIECAKEEIIGPQEQKIKSYITRTTEIIPVESFNEWHQIQNEATEVEANAGNNVLGEGISVRKEEKGNYGMSKYIINGSGTLNLDQNYYFDGNLTISLNNITGNGSSFILAEGDIIIQGNTAENKNYEKICLFSKKGNIKFESSKSIVTGLAVAPWGNIVFQGEKNQFEGNFIGNGIVVNSSNSSFSKPVNFDNKKIVQDIWESHPHYKFLIQVLMQLISKDSKNKIGVIQYTSSASSQNNRFDLFDMKNQKKKEELLEHIWNKFLSEKSEDNNLGDAIRRAYLSFNDANISDPNAQKYVVVLTGVSPNMYSADDTDYKLLGDTSNPKTDSVLASQYASAYSKKLVEKNIKTMYVDLTKFTGVNNSTLKTIATSAGVDLKSEFLTVEHKESDNAYTSLEDALINNKDSVKELIDKMGLPAEGSNGLKNPPLVPSKVGDVNVVKDSFSFTENLPVGVTPKGIKLEGANKDDSKVVLFQPVSKGSKDLYLIDAYGKRWDAKYVDNSYSIQGVVPCALEYEKTVGDVSTYTIYNPKKGKGEPAKFSMVVTVESAALDTKATGSGLEYESKVDLDDASMSIDISDTNKVLITPGLYDFVRHTQKFKGLSIDVKYIIDVT